MIIRNKMNSWNGYKFEKKLGDGALGRLWLTSKNGTPLVIKVMSKNQIKKLSEKFYVTGEITNLDEIKDSNQNLLKIVEHGEDKKSYYIVTEFYNGGNVADYLEKKIEEDYGSPFSEEEVQHVMKNILPALNYLHSQHILHGDLNLDNLLIHYNTEADRQAKNILNSRIIIAYFGFSKLLEPGEFSESDLGNAPYKDPKLLLKNMHIYKGSRDDIIYHYDVKLDIWSLGILSYKMLMGYWAFSGQFVGELLENVSKGIYFLPDDIHQETFDFITSMLHFDLLKRPTTDDLLQMPFIKNPVSKFHELDTVNLRKLGRNIIISAKK